MDFFRGALQAAEKAAEIAKNASQQGLVGCGFVSEKFRIHPFAALSRFYAATGRQVLAGGAAEQAAKKFGKLGLQEKLGPRAAKERKPSPDELAAVGINDSYLNMVSELHFSTFRQAGSGGDFPKDKLLPVQGQPVDDQEFLLNPWQIQHATLLCAEAKDIHELRFMLCPRYMTDGHFWHTYFSLMKPHLPAESLTWPMDTPFVNPKPEQPAAPVSSLLSDFRSQIQSLGSQVQAAAHMTSVSGAGPASVELADTASARGGQGPEAGGVGISEEDRGMDEERDSGTTPDLDFDDYLNELAAEGSKEDGGEAADPTTHP
ncbi:hypothetical protein APUTEX25_000689 [Auxenochlorella protothecoides]|uniref:BSD domain-containing protein n=1 Tax=Auxenochlorella protothecoides TaxID=3075 RepID=A0A3M7KRE4_AUXPR|nr:hypothetical protein APUTEX25_000689 [Auxenochlorella protothecoides]|eukprot:RMZ52414.1 hypothetical protein APUTEX25_000689 [Auxenochlorella protothecoides]